MLAGIPFAHLEISARSICVVAIALLMLPRTVEADEPLNGDYLAQVKPILAERCYACHGALKQEAGLRLDTVASMMDRRSEGEPVVVSGNADRSLLVERITSRDLSIRMPPEGKSLTEQEIVEIKDWIDRGAQAPVDDQSQEDPRKHWSFQPPRKAPFIDEGKTTSLHPIDRWLELRQIPNGIVPLEEADRKVLLRRAYLDLIGLPPAIEDIERWSQSTSAQWYDELIDQLLARPEYGERWGRHWMDVWRYSDWYGRRSVPDVMNSYPQIWRWRDWIVRSLNSDKGYDQMIREMLAADELCSQEPENLVATGFLVRNWYKWNYETWMKDNVEHTSKAFLGLTMNCAHCHDHKYDPISHEDYFRFRAFFEPLELRHDRLPGSADPGPFKKYVYAESYGPITAGAIRVFDEKLDAKTFMYRGGDNRNRIDGKPAQEPSPPASLCFEPFSVNSIPLPATAFYPGLSESIRQEERMKARSLLEAARSDWQAKRSALTTMVEGQGLSEHGAVEGGTSLDRQEARWQLRLAESVLAVAEAQCRSVECRLAADWERYLVSPPDEHRREVLATEAHRSETELAYERALEASLRAEHGLLMAERVQAQTSTQGENEKKAAAEGLSKAQQALEASRKEVEQARQGLLVSQSTYTSFSPKYPETSTGRRTALANWIADRRNPLTARVAVNHVWLRHFGQALVESTDNFGVRGKSPLHPELLDWLAVDFMEHGWSMKHLHRMIMTSQAYKRSSRVGSREHPNQVLDQDNRWYWRFPVRRMEAEVVRDSLLACANLNDGTRGGPEVDLQHWSTSGRRSLYFASHGENQMAFLNTFDGPNVSECYRRASTILPQQALAMTNGELTVHCGRTLAARWKVTTLPDLGDPQVDLDQGKSEVETQWLVQAFLTVLTREPTKVEIDLAQKFLEDQLELLRAVSAEERNRESVAGVRRASPDDQQRARENLVISLFSHNDFVTIR